MVEIDAASTAGSISDGGSERRQRCSEQARRMLEMIRRSELDVQKIHFLLMKLDNIKVSKGLLEAIHNMLPGFSGKSLRQLAEEIGVLMISSLNVLALMAQPITSESSSSLVVMMGGVDGDSCIFPHLLDSRLPHNPGFPSKELLSKASNWLPCGMGPSKRLWDTLKTSRNVNLVSSCGIPPESLFIDRSSDSRSIMLDRDDGILPSRLLLDRFRA
ncbi:hypothetical protein Cgig2_033163 [Carnegiea gigantea]|uniref:Uncharacterized protein n=1 Tax=Carnegiea gigantea TaxID=171969 RepID=A0A9Q1GSL4_9CARY|nr:hypothetical protein Cgig2_033163 [Carnegiea gigantea]